MKKLAAVLLSPWVLYGVALIVFAALVWIFGPALGGGGYYPLEPALPRLVLIGFVLFLYVAINLRRTLRARARERALIQAMAKPEPEADPDAVATGEELALVGERLRDALTTLRGSKKRGVFGATYLYDLPWYMFIGPPAPARPRHWCIPG